MVNLRKFIFQTPVFIFFIFFNQLFAQEPCNEEIIMAIKGKWAKRPDASMNAGNLPQVISRIDKMQKLLQAAYPEPIGIEAAWYRSTGGYNSSVSSNAESYVLNALFKTYYCNKNLKKLLLGGETANWFYVWVNKFSWFMNKDDNFLVENKPIYLLTKRLGELNGFPLFAGGDNKTSNTGTTFSKTILISRTGQLPYSSVSRKQYLLAFLKNKEGQQKQYVESLLKMQIRSDAEEELYKKQQLERVANQEQNEQTKEKAKANFLRGYKTDKQRQQDDISRVNEVYLKNIKNAQDYMANTSNEELNKPAYLEDYSYGSSFLKFGSEKDGKEMVQVNSSYFNSKQASYIPQFMVVYWSWNTEKPSLDFANHIENNFNFKALEQMLDK